MNLGPRHDECQPVGCEWLTTNAFNRARHAFSGWNTAADGTGAHYADSAQFPVTSNTTLYAQWTLLSAGYVALTPSRVYDSRQDAPLIGGADAREPTVADVGDVPADVDAVVLNVTSTVAGAGGPSVPTARR